MRDAARREGYRHLDRLARDWAAGAVRFDRPGEALLAARVVGALLALPDRPAGATVVNAPDAEARAFWERLGFRPADDEGCTHRLDTRRTG